MPVPTQISSLSTTASSNGPDGATEQGSVLDDYQRAAFALFRSSVSAGADVTAAATITPPTNEQSFNLGGTTTVTAISSTGSWDGRVIVVRHTGAHSFTHSSTLNCIGQTSPTFASGDFSVWRQRTSGTWDQIAAGRVGFDLNIPRSTTTTTAVLADRGKCIAVSAGIAIPNSTFAAGDAISIYNDSASSVTITASITTLRLAGTSSTGNRTLAARGLATVWFNSSTEAIISGAGVS